MKGTPGLSPGVMSSFPLEDLHQELLVLLTAISPGSEWAWHLAPERVTIL